MKKDVTRLTWFFHKIKWFRRRVRHVLTGEYGIDFDNYAGKGNSLHTVQDGNDYLRKMILSGAPFASGRCSFSEFGIMECVQNEKFYNSKLHYYWTPSTINVTGIKNFTVDGSSSKGIHKFYDLMMDSIDTVDAVGCFINMPMADMILQMSDTINEKYLYNANALSPCCLDGSPWVSALKGKKVLVVNPFANLIEKQYHHIDKIWTNGMMNGIELQTDSSIWWPNKSYNNWFEALDCLTDRILKHNFDVALLGCGPFGFPLAARIKSVGKQAIHVGGAVQLLFGLKGKRWDGLGYYNDYWIRPGNDTKPDFAETLDKSTYW